MAAADQWRVQFDADVRFSNGGGLQAQGFRLDVPRPDVADDEVGDLFVRHLGLLMVGEVTIRNRTALREPHKGSRGVPADGAGADRSVVDLGRAEAAGHGPLLRTPTHVTGWSIDRLVDLPGLLVRVAGAAEDAIDRPALVPYDVAGSAVLVETGAPAGRRRITGPAAAWLAEQGAALVGVDRTDCLDGAGGSPAPRDVLLAAGVPVVEGLSGLDRLPPHGFRIHVVPLAGGRPALGTGSAPAGVHAYAVTPGA